MEVRCDPFAIEFVLILICDFNQVTPVAGAGGRATAQQQRDRGRAGVLRDGAPPQQGQFLLALVLLVQDSTPPRAQNLLTLGNVHV